MQIRHRMAQDSPAGEQRKPPEGMPTNVPIKQSAVQKPPVRDVLPVQKPVTDEPEPVVPAKWKAIVKRVFAVIGLILALALVYVFLLMGEPDEDDQLTTQTTTQEETIRVPIAASEVAGNADLNPLAVNFGQPVLALYGTSLPLQKATLFDTAFHGGYARRLTLQYAFDDGQLLTVESIRPTGAVSLLAGGGYRLRLESLYTIAGMDAVRMDDSDTACVIARGTGASYAVLCPLTHADELTALLKSASLMQAATQ